MCDRPDHKQPQGSINLSANTIAKSKAIVMQNNRAILPLLLAVMCLCNGSVLSQTRRRPTAQPSSPPAATPKRPVTVTVRNGNPPVGNFIQADTNTIQIEVKGARQSIKIDDVVSIAFINPASSTQAETPPAERRLPCPPLTDEQKRLVLAALAELERTSKVYNIESYYSEAVYNALLLAGDRTQKALDALPDCQLRRLLFVTITAYKDIGRAEATKNPDVLVELADRYKLEGQPRSTWGKRVFAIADELRVRTSALFLRLLEAKQ